MEIQKIIKREKNEIDCLLREINSHTWLHLTDKLKCSSSNKIPQYFINGIYLPKSKLAKASELAQRDYENKLLPVLQSLKQKLEDLDEVYEKGELEEVYTKMCEGRRRLVKPYFIEKDEYIQKWIAEEYDRWEISDEKKDGDYAVKGEFFTVKGERVRSKSEKIIADELARFQVPYRYEYPLELNTGSGIKTVRPDFVALSRRTLKEYVIEHLGMMDRAEYNNAALNKLDLYEKNGYLIGRDLLLLHETSYAPLNMSVLDRYIQEYLL